MKKIFSMLCFFMALQLLGCGMAPKGTGPVFMFSSPDENNAIVYHYRIQRSSGSGQFYYLFMNNDFVSIIGNGGYYSHKVPPGEYVLAVKSEVRMPMELIGQAIDNARAKVRDVYKFTAEPNSSYFFRYSCALGDEVVEQVEKDVALKELEGLQRFEDIQ